MVTRRSNMDRDTRRDLLAEYLPLLPGMKRGDRIMLPVGDDDTVEIFAGEMNEPGVMRYFVNGKLIGEGTLGETALWYINRLLDEGLPREVFTTERRAMPRARSNVKMPVARVPAPIRRTTPDEERNTGDKRRARALLTDSLLVGDTNIKIRFALFPDPDNEDLFLLQAAYQRLGKPGRPSEHEDEIAQQRVAELTGRAQEIAEHDKKFKPIDDDRLIWRES